MKALKIALALATPGLIAAGNLPNNYEFYDINTIQWFQNLTSDDDFRLPKQSYYKELFTAKELKKLAKAESYREKSREALVLAAAIQKQADELKSSADVSSKVQKQAAKLDAKAAKQELSGLKLFEKAADIYRVVYTNELNNKTFSASTISERTAQNLALDAQNDYHAADALKESATSENTLECYRGMYAKLCDAIHSQEIAFAIFKGDSNVDYTKYLEINAKDSTQTGNVAKEDIPALKAKVKYDFTKDTNIYELRYPAFCEKLKFDTADITKIRKMEADIANSITLFQKAETFGCTADTFRVYSGESGTLAEREYYEQKAQESELNECSNMLKAIKLEVNSNNTLFNLYRKYIAKVRNEKNTVGISYEETAENLFQLSQSYESVAAKQVSHVEQYTQLSEGNEVKLQAIQNMENAIAAFLGDVIEPEQMSLATGATDKHNDVALDFAMDESDGAASKPVASNSTAKPNTVTNTSNTKPANTVVSTNTSTKSASNTAKKTTPKTTNTSTKPTSTTSSKTTAKTTPKTTAAKSTVSREKVPEVVSSSAAVLSTSYYTREDQRMKPYTYPKGTIFSVEAGIYKEMVEPVEFPAVENFLAQNLKGQTFMRYYIGTFKTYDAAYAALDMAKEDGYSRAQVVAFVNGKKTDVNTAKKNAEKTSGYQSLVQSELKALNSNRNATTPVSTVASGSNSGAAVPLSLLGNTYAVQISSVPTLLGMDAFNVNELYYDQNDAGLYRYYTGVSNDINIANANLSIMKQSGYEDAYLIRVVNGTNQGSAAQYVAQQSKNTVSASGKQVFRVQIGAYKAALSQQSVQQINRLKNLGYTIHSSKSGEYTVYTVGDCTTRAQADKLRKDLVAKGYAEAYVVTFINGVKQ